MLSHLTYFSLVVGTNNKTSSSEKRKLSFGERRRSSQIQTSGNEVSYWLGLELVLFFCVARAGDRCVTLCWCRLPFPKFESCLTKWCLAPSLPALLLLMSNVTHSPGPFVRDAVWFTRSSLVVTPATSVHTG